MNFHNINLPPYIELFAVGSSEFATSCVISSSGREARSSDTQIARRRYTLKDCRLSLAEFEEFNSFFMSRSGRRFSFRLKDYFDFSVDKQLINSSNDTATQFQLYKLYQDDFRPYMRKITKPKIGTLKFWLAREEVIPHNIDYDTGIVTFLTPQNGGDNNLVASFESDVPVRFAEDSFTYSLNQDGTIKLDNIELIEVIE